jgi:hypothetical protein
MSQTLDTATAVIGIGIGRSLFQVARHDERGAVRAGNRGSE